MKGWTSVFMLALLACSAGDDTADGTRGQCAEGGELNSCSDTPHTVYEACWRMVDCGAILLHENDPNATDWNHCVERIEDAGAPQERLMIECIAAATCDQLKADRRACFAYGDN